MTRSTLLNRLLAHFRSRRMRAFEKRFEITDRTRILDVGGSAAIWKFASVHPRLTLLNLPSALDSAPQTANQVAGDGRMLPFRDRSFEIVFSNSVIEHVGSTDDQQSFASEIRRVANAYWIQTPDRHAPIEMHLMLPLVHFLPKRLQRAIIERFTVWEVLVRPGAPERRFYLDHFLHELRLLDANGLRRLFPDAVIVRERIWGVPKSLIAVRLPRAEPSQDAENCLM